MDIGAALASGVVCEAEAVGDVLAVAAFDRAGSTECVDLCGLVHVDTVFVAPVVHSAEPFGRVGAVAAGVGACGDGSTARWGRVIGQLAFVPLLVVASA